MSFVEFGEPVFYSPPVKKNRILIPGAVIIVIIVLIIAFLLWRRWQYVESFKENPQFECVTSKECGPGEICSSINTCELFLAPF